MDSHYELTCISEVSLPHHPLASLEEASDLCGLHPEMIEEFLRAFSVQGGLNLHVALLDGRDTHHMAEAVFKGLARALDQATQIDSRVQGVPSTKGQL